MLSTKTFPTGMSATEPILDICFFKHTNSIKIFPTGMSAAEPILDLCFMTQTFSIKSFPTGMSAAEPHFKICFMPQTLSINLSFTANGKATTFLRIPLLILVKDLKVADGGNLSVLPVLLHVMIIQRDGTMLMDLLITVNGMA